MTSPISTLATLRRFLLAVLVFGLVGTVTELLLIGHDEDTWQVVPIAVIGFALGASAWMVASMNAASTRVFRASMVLLILAGGTGAVLHYGANRQFQVEMDPSLAGFALFSKSVQAKVPPALAPGNLALFGLMGLISVWRREV